MNASDEHVRGLISQRAADWFVANRSGLTPHERQFFTDWLKTSPVHVEEYLAIMAISRDLPQACAVSAGSIDDLVTRAHRQTDATVEPIHQRIDSKPATAHSRVWQFAAVALTVAVLVVGRLVVLRNFESTPGAEAPPDRLAAIHYRTGHGEQKTLVLADKSIVHLNTDSDIAIRYSKTQRSVSLTSGEAAFEVWHENARPFRVTANSANIIDVGTKFNVRLTGATTVITVMEGRVEVLPSDSESTGLQVAAGGQISVTGGVLPTAAVSVDIGRATAWLHRQISFDREPLEQVAAEFNRYAQKSIEITTPALRSLQVSGIFTTQDTAAFIAFLRSLDNVQVEETATQIIVSPQRPPRRTR